MHRLIIALAALVLFGAQLTAPAEAQGSWTCTYDFSTGQHGWTAPTGSYSAGAFQTADVFAYGSYYWRAAYAASPTFTSTTVTSVAAHFTLSEGSYASGGPSKIEIVKPGIAQLQSVDWNGTTPSSPFTWTGSTAATQINVGVVASSATSATYSGSATITKIVITGTGTQPSNCPQDATPTPAPSSTPAPTPTEVDPVMFAQSNWSCPFDLRSQLQGWQVITGSYVPGAGIQGAYPSTNQKISVTLPLNSGTTLYDIRLDYDSTTGTETILRADGVTFDDANGMPAGNQIVWWQGNQAFNNSLNIEIIGSLFTPATMYLKNVMLRGYGGAPPCSNSGLPQPTPVPVIVEAGNLWTGLADANNTLNSLGPGSVGSGVPNETGRQLFGYVKWLVSPSSADELAGPFAPLISHTGVFIALLFALILVYAIVWAVIWILRFIYWLYRLIVQIIDLVLQVAQVIGSAVGQVGQLIGGFIGSAIKFLF